MRLGWFAFSGSVLRGFFSGRPCGTAARAAFSSRLSQWHVQFDTTWVGQDAVNPELEHQELDGTVVHRDTAAVESRRMVSLRRVEECTSAVALLCHKQHRVARRMGVPATPLGCQGRIDGRRITTARTEFGAFGALQAPRAAVVEGLAVGST